MIKQKSTQGKKRKQTNLMTISPKMVSKPKSVSKSKEMGKERSGSNTSRTLRKKDESGEKPKSTNKQKIQHTPAEKYDRYMEMRASTIIKESAPSINKIKYTKEKGVNNKLQLSLHVNATILEEAIRARQQLQMKLKELQGRREVKQQAISAEVIERDFGREVQMQTNEIKQRVRRRQGLSDANTINRGISEFQANTISHTQTDRKAEVKRLQDKVLAIKTENDELKRTIKQEMMKAKLFKQNLNKTQQICEKYQDKIKCFQNDKARIKEQSIQILKLIGSQYADLFTCNPDL